MYRNLPRVFSTVRDFLPVTLPVRSPIRSSTPLRRSRLPPSRGGAESRCAYLPQQPPFRFPAASLVGGDLSSPSVLTLGSIAPVHSRNWAQSEASRALPHAALRGLVGEALVDASVLEVCPISWRQGEEIPDAGAIADPRRTRYEWLIDQEEDGHKGHSPQVAIIIKFAKHLRFSILRVFRPRL